MFYINSTPNQFGNYGNPTSNYKAGMVAISTELLSDYISTKGFAYLTIENENVTSVTVNQEALDAYEASLPPVEPAEPTEEDDVNSMLVDHEYRLTLLELGV